MLSLLRRRRVQCLELLDECRKIPVEAQTVELHSLGTVEQATVAHGDLLERLEHGKLVT
jgi:hypothetical protein